jgi:hypothetical protein
MRRDEGAPRERGGKAALIAARSEQLAQQAALIAARREQLAQQAALIAARSDRLAQLKLRVMLVPRRPDRG